MLYTHSGSLPRHQYVWVQPKALGDHDWMRAMWFGVVSYPGRLWGCHLILESGAVYRNVPLHQIAAEVTNTKWETSDAATWDCYGYGFSLLEYSAITGMRGKVRLSNKTELKGNYLFTAVPIGDGFSAYPEQSKEFFFFQLDNHRFTAQPTNHVLIEDRSFITALEFPRNLERQTQVYSAERKTA